MLEMPGPVECTLTCRRNVNTASRGAWAPDKLKIYSWALQLARALAFLHNCKPVVIHRDLKPCNLLLDRAGNLKVCDFGLSKIKDQVSWLHPAYARAVGDAPLLSEARWQIFLRHPD